MGLSFDSLNHLFRSHPAIKLLRAEHAPLILSFLDRVFIQPNVRFMSQSELVSGLEDTLYVLRESEGEDMYPRSAQAYLDDWAQNEKGWLRKFYPENSDEPHYDLTPSAEKAIAWIDGLSSREFVGTESRLMTVFELLRQMVLGSEEDTKVRIAELEKKKQEIEDRIAAIHRGEFEIMDGTALRDRFMQFSAMARELLSDFRTVEHNFRQLDASVREKITLWEGSKGELLEQIFGERDMITDSDQGRSFRAFWDFLMSTQSQEELTSLLETVFSLEALSSFAGESRLKRIHFDWLEAGEHTQRTVAGLSGQLRRYLDNQAYLENKRIMGILEDITVAALNTRDNPPRGTFMETEDPAVQIRLPLERRLFEPAARLKLTSDVSVADGGEIDCSVLLHQFFVDTAELRENIRRELVQRDQIALHDLISKYPLNRGLAELVAYLSIASDEEDTVFDDDSEVHVTWNAVDGREKKASIPLVIFNRRTHG
ncbi:MAG: DUF3375 domain-containing protein [Spirochaetales bacterium]|nr:DUF3375 domain-containing protein [Spirochaetales bacterium]